MHNLAPIEMIENKIYLIRGHKVMLDSDLAQLYGVKTFVLNQAVKRNRERFPGDFMFSLSKEEKLRISQTVISSFGKKNLKYSKNINVFTENGIAMLSSALRSKRAIQINIQIIRIFTKLRNMILKHKELSQKMKELELHVGQHDQQIRSIFEAIKKIMAIEEKPKKKIGFLVDRS